MTATLVPITVRRGGVNDAGFLRGGQHQGSVPVLVLYSSRCPRRRCVNSHVHMRRLHTKDCAVRLCRVNFHTLSSPFRLLTFTPFFSGASAIQTNDPDVMDSDGQRADRLSSQSCVA